MLKHNFHTCAAQSPPVWNAGAATAGGIAVAAAVGVATSSAQFSVVTAPASTSLTQPGSAAAATSTGLVKSLAGAISLAACSSFSACKIIIPSC